MLEPLYILPPDHVPSESSLHAWTTGVSARFPAFPAVGLSNSEMADYLERLNESLPANGSSLLEPAGQAEDVAHDAYFFIGRRTGEEASVFARMVLATRIIFLRDVERAQVSVSQNVLSAIDESLGVLTECIFGASADAARRVTVWEWSDQRQESKLRWVRGHQLFAALTQGLIFTFQELARALREGKSSQVRRWSDVSASLLRGSAAAFEFTGDFAPEDYAAVIRPSMMPPQSEVGLSGLMSIDHRFLVRAMRDMRPSLKALHDQDQARHQKLSKDLSSVYDSHIHVCERFVGKQPSILTAGRTERSGPSLIEQFKTLRLKPFEEPVRTTRLAQGNRAAADMAARCPFSTLK